MSDFIKALIGTMAEEGMENGDNAVYDQAIIAANKCIISLKAEAKPMADEGNYFKASLFLFIATWAIVGAMHSGVESSIQRGGKRSIVAKLWHLVRIAFASSGGVERTMARLETFDEDWEGGKYDDVH